MEFLVNHGANVNAKTFNLATPLHFARDVEMVDLLLSLGADINAQDKVTQLKALTGSLDLLPCTKLAFEVMGYKLQSDLLKKEQILIFPTSTETLHFILQRNIS